MLVGRYNSTLCLLAGQRDQNLLGALFRVGYGRGLDVRQELPRCADSLSSPFYCYSTSNIVPNALHQPCA